MPNRDRFLRTLGLRVRHLREERGFTQEKLGEKAQLDQTYISGIESSGRNRTILSVVLAAKALKVSLAQRQPAQASANEDRETGWDRCLHERDGVYLLTAQIPKTRMNAEDAASLKIEIQNVINALMERVMNKVLFLDPFLVDKFRAEKPLYAALVPEEIFKGSHFERRFVTPFGGAWEKLATVAAKHGLGHAEAGYIIHGQIGELRLKRINEVLNRLEHGLTTTGRVKPDWDAELDYILNVKGRQIPVSVVCDIFVSNAKTKKNYAFELKGPLHNSDQAKVSKEKLLKIHAMDPKIVDEAYFCLPYNPYGLRKDYTWSHPARWFNMKEDKVVLIGDEFWNKMGGEGTYQAFVTAVNEIGAVYRERIYKEYLGIEPPFRETPTL